MANALTDRAGPLRATGRVREPYGDRESPPIDEHDIGAVAATVLTQDGHAGRSYHLTGPEVAHGPRDGRDPRRGHRPRPNASTS
ncbi:hypothetical protein [Nonomuraea composti]|uniref:hypothetical protein n=1 Tax=Nonomuraea composti TaxID=2720023 RepID=UPI00197F4D9D|nr:hypothetical protein [Nonomuraea sp. FMUSA5-5]